MEASRRGRPGVLSALLFSSWLRGEAFTLLRRQLLVLGPLLAQLAALLWRDLDDLLVGLARLAALLGGELRPGLHAPLHALLTLRRHLRVALGDGDPLAPALWLEAFPVGLERREDLLLLRSKLGPCGAHLCFGLGKRLGRLLLRGRLAWHVDRRLSERGSCQEDREDEPRRPHHSSPARFFSQSWNPRSR